MSQQFSRAHKSVIYLLLVLLLLGIPAILWLRPHALALYHQVRGGQLLAQVLAIASGDNPAAFACTLEPVMDDTARQQLLLAIEHLNRAVEYDPNLAQAFLLLGRAECLAMDFDAAVQAYTSYFSLRSGNILGNLEIGFAYEAAGDLSTAIEYWLSDGLIADHFLKTGKEAFDAKDYLAALAWYQRAELTRSGWNRPWYQSSLTYQQMGKMDEAMKVMLDGIAQSQGSEGLSNMYYQIGWIRQYYLKPADTKGAWEAYEQALSIRDFSYNPVHYAATIQNQGFLLAGQGHYYEAIQKYEAAIDLYPSLYWAHLGLARAFWQTGEHQKAKDAANQAILLSPDPSEAYIALGDFSRAEGDLDQARQFYIQALDINPKSTNAQTAIEKLETTP